jgi:DNA-binding NarL/FixJ family response regulator
MDINMPIMDGVVATKRLKEILPAIVIVGLSVNPSPHLRKAMTSAGASDFISKEMAADDLYTAIISVVQSDMHWT